MRSIQIQKKKKKSYIVFSVEVLLQLGQKWQWRQVPKIHKYLQESENKFRTTFTRVKNDKNTYLVRYVLHKVNDIRGVLSCSWNLLRGMIPNGLIVYCPGRCLDSYFTTKKVPISSKMVLSINYISTFHT